MTHRLRLIARNRQARLASGRLPVRLMRIAAAAAHPRVKIAPRCPNARRPEICGRARLRAPYRTRRRVLSAAQKRGDRLQLSNRCRTIPIVGRHPAHDKNYQVQDEERPRRISRGRSCCSWQGLV